MRQLWRKYAARIDALSLRERLMVFGAVAIVVLFIMNALFIDQPLTRKKTLSTRMTQQQTELQALQARIDALEKNRIDPDAANVTRRDDIKRRIGEINDSLKSLEHSLVPAPNMKGLLQQMLARDPRLQLIAMRTLPVTPLVEKSDKGEKSDAASAGKPPEKPGSSAGGVFKHGVQITVQGSYSDLHDYLARLEKQSVRMFWSRASMNADDYPRVTLTVTIYTLSLDKAWLVV